MDFPKGLRLEGHGERRKHNRNTMEAKEEEGKR